jgi:hypothetical protein
MLNKQQIETAALIALEYDSHTPAIKEFDAKIQQFKDGKAQEWELREQQQKKLLNRLEHWSETGTDIGDEDKTKIIAACKRRAVFTKALEAMVAYCISTVMRVSEARRHQQQQKAQAKKEEAYQKAQAKKQSNQKGTRRARDIESEIVEAKRENQAREAEETCRQSLRELYFYVEAHLDFVTHADIPRWYQEIQTQERSADHANH